ncbi:TPA: hypothetical protein ACFP4Y_000717 [Neisseria bacilliformis]
MPEPHHPRPPEHRQPRACLRHTPYKNPKRPSESTASAQPNP